MTITHECEKPILEEAVSNEPGVPQVQILPDDGTETTSRIRRERSQVEIYEKGIFEQLTRHGFEIGRAGVPAGLIAKR